MMIYLDNAATSYRKPKCVYNSFMRATAFYSANAGRGGHRLSIDTMNKVYTAAENVAKLFSIDNPENIAFTQNATFALNMAIGGILTKNSHAVITGMEHNSVSRPVNVYGKYTVVPADRYGYVSAEDIEAAIMPDTKLIVCTHASNVCGSIQPVKEIGRIAKKHDIPFLLDAAQTAGCYPINLRDINVDMMAFSGHKGLLAPLGTGGLYVNEKIKLNPIITGGTGSNSESIMQPDFMPDVLHSGTLNSPAIIALGTACKFIKEHSTEEIHYREKYLAEKLTEDLSTLKGVKLYSGMCGKPHNGTVAFNLNNLSSTEVSEYLDKHYNIAVRAGFHCSPLAHKSIGTGENGCVRASFGFYSNINEEKALAKAISRLCR